MAKVARRAHLCGVVWCQGYIQALIAPLSPITLLIRKPRLIWRLPGCIWLHLPGRAPSSPSSHPFSKLLILCGVTEGSTGQMDTRACTATQKHTLLMSLFLDTNVINLHLTLQMHTTQIYSDWGITKRPGIEWTCTLVCPQLFIISISLCPFLIQPFPISLLFKPLCIKEMDSSTGRDVCVCVHVSIENTCACMHWEWGNTYLAYGCTAPSGRSCRRRSPLVSEQTKRNIINKLLLHQYKVCHCDDVVRPTSPPSSYVMWGVSQPHLPQTHTLQKTYKQLSKWRVVQCGVYCWF